MSKIHLRIILKSGAEFTAKVEDYTIKWSSETSELTSFNFQGCTENVPIFLSLSQVAAVVRVFSNEIEESNKSEETEDE